jgi:hypothetical protein
VTESHGSSISGYRRRILIEPAPGRVTAELEDDYHRMVVTLFHRDGVVTDIESDMKRWPWTTCPGAMAQLRNTFLGQALADFVSRGQRTANCTHLHDLALFGAAHADEEAPVAYDIFVSDAVDGARRATLQRNEIPVFDWTIRGDRFLAPADLKDLTIRELGGWIAAQDRPTAEAARVLRWASMVALGRGMTIPAGISATTIPGGTCFTFQPDMAAHSTRLPGADVDFSRPGAEPMADRSNAFHLSAI